MCLLALLLPLMSSLFVLFFGHFVGSSGVFGLVLGSLALGLGISWLLFYEICLLSGASSFWAYEWVLSGLFIIKFGFLLDSLSSMVLVVVLFISSVVHMYSVDYMCYEPHMLRFMAYLSLFTFFMLVVVSSNNFVQMFLGWEGVGLVSYLLMNFWFMRLEANKAAIKAMLVNSVGDFGIILAFLFMYFFFKSFAYPVVFSLAPWYAQEFFVFFGFEVHKLSLVSFLLFFGCMAKSAQVGLHTWLVSAMEGPTPVSALLHAATMVTVGVFVVVSCSLLFEYSKLLLVFVALLGSLTALFGAISALFQNDMKKMVACSTSSQLGYMFFSCGLSNYSVGLSHLLAHSFFKALLFLGVGLVIHGCSSEQDMRKFGGLVMFVPVVYVSVLVGSLSLAGFPFLAGFYSKDYLLGLGSFSGSIVSMLAYFLGGISVLFTCAYSFKLLYLVFFESPSMFIGPVYYMRDISYMMCICLMVLVCFSLFEGYFFTEMFLGKGHLFWEVTSWSLRMDLRFLEVELLPLGYSLFPLFCICCGLGYVVFLYLYFAEAVAEYMFGSSYLAVCVFFNQLWHFDYLYSKVFVEVYVYFCHSISYLFMDRGYFEVWGPYGVTWLLDVCSSKFMKMESGYVGQYMFAMLCGVVIMCGWFSLKLGGGPVLMWFSLLNWKVIGIEVIIGWGALAMGGVPAVCVELWWGVVQGYVLSISGVWLSILGVEYLFYGGVDWVVDWYSGASVSALLLVLTYVMVPVVLFMLVFMRYVIYVSMVMGLVFFLLYSGFKGGVVFFFIAAGWNFLSFFLGTLVYWDYFYFLELFYILVLSVFLFVLGDLELLLKKVEYGSRRLAKWNMSGSTAKRLVRVVGRIYVKCWKMSYSPAKFKSIFSRVKSKLSLLWSRPGYLFFPSLWRWSSGIHGIMMRGHAWPFLVIYTLWLCWGVSWGPGISFFVAFILMCTEASLTGVFAWCVFDDFKEKNRSVISVSAYLDSLSWDASVMAFWFSVFGVIGGSSLMWEYLSKVDSFWRWWKLFVLICKYIVLVELLLFFVFVLWCCFAYRELIRFWWDRL